MMELVVVLVCWVGLSFPIALLVGAVFMVGRGDGDGVHYEASREDILSL